MKKAMRKLVAFALAAIVLFSNAPNAFANTVTNEDKVNKLVQLNVLQGEGNGVDSTKTMTRYRSIVMMLRLKGLEADMMAYDYVGKDTFADADGQNGYQQRLMAYIKNNPQLGVIGYPDGTFRPYQEITTKEYVKVLVDALGYDYTWDTVANVAVTIGLADSTADVNTTNTFKVANFADYTYDGLSIKAKDDDVSFGEKLGYPIVVTELAVESVMADNLKEIKVTFNKSVNATNDNFLVNGAKIVKENFNLSADGTVVTLFNQNSTTAGQTVKVIISGIEGLSTSFHDLVLNDNQLPTVESVETIGNSLVKVTFSEPMNSGVTSLSSYKIDNRSKSATITMSNNQRIANIALNSPLANGDYTLSVNASTVKDFAGNSIGINNTNFTIAKYASVPTATVVEATQQDVKVKFNREPKSVGSLYWKQGTTKHSAPSKQDTTDKTIFTFHFTDSNRMSAGDNTVYFSEIKDFSGNTAKDVEKLVTASVDTTRPEFESLTQENGKFEVKFTKPVVANKANYTFTDSKGVKATVSDATIKTSDNTVVVLTVTGLSTTRNPYTVTIEDVIDTTYLQNKASDAIETVEIADNSAPSISGITKKDTTISVVFTEAIDTVTLDNFKYTDNAASTYYTMPAGSYLNMIGTNTVNITVPNTFGPSNGHSINFIEKLYISDVKDLSDNKLIAVTSSVTSANAKVILNSEVYAYDKNTLIMEVAEPLVDVWSGDFKVMAGSEELTLNNAELLMADTDINKYASTSGHSNKFTDAAQLIKLTLEKDLDNVGKYNGQSLVVSTQTDVQVTKNALDVKLEVVGKTVKDNIISDAPVKDNFAYDNSTTLSVAKSFVVNENVGIEYLVQATGTAATISTPKTGDMVIIGSAKDIFSSADTATITALTSNQELFVRFVDEAGNKTDWVSIATVE